MAGLDVISYSNGDAKSAAALSGLHNAHWEDLTLVMETENGTPLRQTFPAPPKGDKGEKGDTGEKGEPFRYSDFTQEQLEALKGADGRNGRDGTNGVDGVSPSIDVKKSTSTEYILTITDKTHSFDTPNLKGSGGGGGGASTAEEVSYSFATHPEWDNVKKALDGIIDKIEYVKPTASLTMSPSTTDYEIGQSVTSLRFNWSYNKTIKTQSLTDCPLADANVRTANWSGNLTSNKTFTLTANDGQNSVSASKTINFKHRLYYGVAALPSAFDSAFILGLSNKNFATSYRGTYNVNVGAGQYAFVACPASWNMPNTCKIGGFGTDLVDCGTIQFTNASGNTTAFKIVRTSQANLGSISMLFE